MLWDCYGKYIEPVILQRGLAWLARWVGPSVAVRFHEYESSWLLDLTLAWLICIRARRLGFITIFLSHTVISGFTTGAAVIIGMSQVKYIFGYDIPKSDVLQEVIQYIIEGISQFNYKTFLVGSFAILALVAMKHIGKTYPKFKWIRAAGPLTVCVISIVLNVIFDLEGKGIPVVGSIPKGFPKVTTDLWFPIANADKLMLVGPEKGVEYPLVCN